MKSHMDARIIDEAHRIAAEPGVLAVLLAGSHARGQPWPHSDVDLLVIIEHGPSRTIVAGK